MNSIAKSLTYLAVTLAVAGCAAPNNYVVVTEQACARFFHGPCPTARYTPPALIPPPAGPVPDLNLREMSCDNIFGKNVVTAHVRNDGDANAQAASSSGDPVIVTVIAALRSGGMEMAQGSGGGPGFLAVGAEAPGIHVQLSRDWTQYAHVSVSAESVIFNAERNYSNNDLEADVAPSALSSNGFDTVYCQAQR